MIPAVWNDAKPRIQAAATSLSLPVCFANDPAFDPGALAIDANKNPVPWLDVDATSTADEPIELTGGMWQLVGTIWLFVMVPTFTGIDTGYTLRKSLMDAFRGVTGAPAGLVYPGPQYLDPLGAPQDNGNYRPLPLGITFKWQDR